MRELDETVDQMIHEYYPDTSHHPAPDDREPVSSAFTGRASDRAWEKNPITRNPGIAELEARTDQRGVDPVPRDTAARSARVLDFNGLLAQTIASAPEYRSAKEDLMLAALALIVERRSWGPRFFANVSQGLSGTPEAGDHDTAAGLIGQLGVAQKLPYGGEVSISALSSFTSYLSQQAASTAFSDTQSSQLQLALTVPLLRGSGRVAQEAWIQSERNLIYGARTFETFRRNLMVDMAGTYFTLLQSRKAIANARTRRESLNQTHERLRALVKAGAAAPIDADNAEQQVRAAQSLIAEAEDAYRLQIDRLKVRLGLPVSSPLDLLDDDFEVPIPELVLSRALDQAKLGRLDLQTSRDQLDDAARAAEIARDGLRGDLDFSGEASLGTDPSQRYGGGNLDAGSGTYAARLKYSLPLYRVPEQVRLKQSLIGIAQSRRAYETSLGTVETNVRAAIRDIERARLTFSLQEKNIELAKRRLEQAKLKERTLGFRPILDAENDLLDARNNRDQAVTDLRLSVLRYLNETGQIRVNPQGRWIPPEKLTPLEPERRAPPDAKP